MYALALLHTKSKKFDVGGVMRMGIKVKVPLPPLFFAVLVYTRNDGKRQRLL